MLFVFLGVVYKQEFDRSKTLIDSSLKSVLDDKKISKALIKNSVEKLSGNKRLYIFSDHSDSRKPYSKKLENLGKVRDLNGNIINVQKMHQTGHPSRFYPATHVA